MLFLSKLNKKLKISAKQATQQKKIQSKQKITGLKRYRLLLSQLGALSKRRKFFVRHANKKGYLKWKFGGSFVSQNYLKEPLKKKGPFLLRRIFKVFKVNALTWYKGGQKRVSPFAPIQYTVQATSHDARGLQRLGLAMRLMFDKELFSVSGLVGIPRNKYLITLLRSPHVNKKHREQFYYSPKSVLFTIKFKQCSSNKMSLQTISNTTNSVLQAFKANLPIGCEVKVSRTVTELPSIYL